MNFSKAVTETYRFSSGGDFANFYIDSSDGATSGTILIHSSFGTWSRYWGSCGDRFKHFLVDLHIEYTATKFGCGNWFDAATTTARYRSDITRALAKNEITANTAHYIRQEIENLECVREHEFYHVCSDQKRLLKFYGGEPPMATGIEPGFRKFWEMFWIPFCAQLRTEPVFQIPEP